jgi:hypothetical protein
MILPCLRWSMWGIQNNRLNVNSIGRSAGGIRFPILNGLCRSPTLIVPDTNVCKAQARVKPVENDRRINKSRGRIHINAHIVIEGLIGRVCHYYCLTILFMAN